MILFDHIFILFFKSFAENVFPLKLENRFLYMLYYGSRWQVGPKYRDSVALIAKKAPQAHILCEPDWL